MLTKIRRVRRATWTVAVTESRFGEAGRADDDFYELAIVLGQFAGRVGESKWLPELRPSNAIWRTPSQARGPTTMLRVEVAVRNIQHSHHFRLMKWSDWPQ